MVEEYIIYKLYIKDNVLCVLIMLPNVSFGFIFSFLLSFPLSVSGGWETNYSCCASAVGSPGCQVAKVSSKNSTTKSDNILLKGFVSLGVLHFGLFRFHQTLNCVGFCLAIGYKSLPSSVSFCPLLVVMNLLAALLDFAEICSGF